MQTLYSITGTKPTDAPSDIEGRNFLRHAQVTIVPLDAQGDPIVDGTETGKVLVQGIPVGATTPDATKFQEEVPIAVGGSVVLEGFFSKILITPKTIAVAASLKVQVTQSAT